MMYSLEQLKSLILPIMATLTAPAVGQNQVEAAADAVVEIIKQDREVIANKLEKILNDTAETNHD